MHKYYSLGTRMLKTRLKLQWWSTNVTVSWPRPHGGSSANTLPLCKSHQSLPWVRDSFPPIAMERAVACTKQLLSIINNYNQSTASDNDKLGKWEFLCQSGCIAAPKAVRKGSARCRTKGSRQRLPSQSSVTVDFCWNIVAVIYTDLWRCFRPRQ